MNNTLVRVMMVSKAASAVTVVGTMTEVSAGTGGGVVEFKVIDG